MKQKLLVLTTLNLRLLARLHPVMKNHSSNCRWRVVASDGKWNFQCCMVTISITDKWLGLKAATLLHRVGAQSSGTAQLPSIGCGPWTTSYLL